MRRALVVVDHEPGECQPRRYCRGFAGMQTRRRQMEYQLGARSAQERHVCIDRQGLRAVTIWRRPEEHLRKRRYFHDFVVTILNLECGT